MKLLKWGDDFPFVEYVINRFFCENLKKSAEEEDVDVDEFLDYLLDHHSSACPDFPTEFKEGSKIDQVYLSFSPKIEALVKALDPMRGLSKRIEKLSNRQKTILATELVIIDFLSRAGDYVFNPTSFKRTVKYVEDLEL